MSLHRVLPSHSTTPARKLSSMIPTPTPTVAEAATVMAAAAMPARDSPGVAQQVREQVQGLALGVGVEVAGGPVRQDQD